ncbi:hypothetical protein HY483_02810 [Candidatus Woesearchaeota archaeon]|nr:hypothetical protein [Candidatus Woesearchaeota archaeon]
MKNYFRNVGAVAALYSSLSLGGCFTTPKVVVEAHKGAHDVTRGDILAYPEEMRATARVLIESALSSNASSPASIFYQSLKPSDRDELVTGYLSSLAPAERLNLVGRASLRDESSLDRQMNALRFVEDSIESYTSDTGVPRSDSRKMESVEGFVSE